MSPFSDARLCCIARLTMTKPDEEAPQTGAAPSTPTETTDMATAARKSAGKAVWMGTAVGIGSAAIVAALLYTSRKRGS